MAKLNKHHITYDPEWIVEIQARWHREITFIQKTKATPEFERILKKELVNLMGPYPTAIIVVAVVLAFAWIMAH